MEVSQLGNHVMSVCPYCNQLFDIVAGEEDACDDLERLRDAYVGHLTQSPGCQEKHDAEPSFDQALAELRECFIQADEERQKRLASHPMNGTLGWWSVAGIRHDAIAKATSATEALEKCVAAGKIGSWEGGDVEFIGKEMPEVF